jgi:hypothetical protein
MIYTIQTDSQTYLKDPMDDPELREKFTIYQNHFRLAEHAQEISRIFGSEEAVRLLHTRLGTYSA